MCDVLLWKTLIRVQCGWSSLSQKWGSDLRPQCSVKIQMTPKRWWKVSSSCLKCSKMCCRQPIWKAAGSEKLPFSWTRYILGVYWSWWQILFDDFNYILIKIACGMLVMLKKRQWQNIVVVWQWQRSCFQAKKSCGPTKNSHLHRFWEREWPKT